MIKIYKVNTFEKLEYLLNTLHEQGAKWCDDCILDDKKAIAKIWNKFNLLEGAYKGLAIYNENGTIIFSTPPFIHYMIKLYEKDGKEYTIIDDVKLPNSKQTDGSQVKQPSHYIGEKGLEVREIEENFLIRYQDGHLAHLAGALLEYLLRAPSKGKLAEDIQKVKYLANEMAEYVEKVSQ